MSLSVVLITKNEEKSLERALESVLFADEIVVVDSLSSDGTADIARRYGAKFIQSGVWLGFGPQKNLALSHATKDWVLSLDADEWLSNDLINEIQAITNANCRKKLVVGYWIKRSSIFIDKSIRFGDWSNDRVLRLFLRSEGAFTNSLIHERLEVTGTSRALRGLLYHQPVRALSDAKRKMWRYNLVAAKTLAEKQQWPLQAPWTHALWSLLRNLVIRLGFLDGLRGLQLAWFNAKGTFIRYEAASRIQNQGRWSRSRRILAYVQLLLIDHGFLRVFYQNRSKLAGSMYRSNQPGPSRLKKYRDHLQVKTVVNLRGSNPQLGWYRLEQEACRKLGLTLISTQLHSRGLPTRERIHELKAIIQSLELPAVVHCKSGADRAGIFAVFYRHFRFGEPIETAKVELHWRYGHFRSAKTGVLDYFFDQYLVTRTCGQTFMEWVDTTYDRERLEKSFEPAGFVSFFVDSLLRRE
jgi:glycosyltransferase involved in cell wall biosynthesis